METKRRIARIPERDRLAVLLALVTAVAVAVTFLFSRDMTFLMPGPLASAHSTIENCSSCHTKSGSGKLSWLHGLVAGDRLADSNGCLTCHRMPDTAFNAHGASAEVLQRSTLRLTGTAAAMPVPHAARAQDIVFPTDRVIARGLYCTTCHQEHQGANFNLAEISNEQCRSCHVVKFDSFDGHHPKFESYPFKRRTRIIFDHAGHFGGHFPETAKKTPERRIPTTCSACHDSSKDKRVMGVAPFAQTCTACHLDQILGNERVSGPKGIAFLALPGLDTQTLKTKKATIGEWPSESEAAITPFMKMMIGRNQRGRALVETMDRLNLQDLSKASNEQIEAVVALVWEIKGLFYALIKEKASDVLARLNIGDAKLDADFLADLTASIPRDVILGAQRQWLPNLGAEMANRPSPSEAGTDNWSTTVTQSRATTDSEKLSRAESRRLSDVNRSADSRNVGMATEVKVKIAEAEAAETGKKAASQSSTQALSATGLPPKKAVDQTDDLLHPTEDELRAMKGGGKGSGRAFQQEPGAGTVGSAEAPPAPPDAAPNAAQALPSPAKVEPVISIESNVDPESWAAYGGWYRQDHAIFYRPTGHKDKFIYAWLFLTGPRAAKGNVNPATAVFEALTGKDAQGSCAKCHSVDDVPGKGRIVNFSPPSVESKRGRFTNFIHEPHLGVLEPRGCLTCHRLEKGGAYLKSYEQGNPQSFVSNFSRVKKELCQTCHTSGMARQDCLLCHSYHVNGTTAPMMSTKIPDR